MALTAKQQAFVREYLIDLNATQAAVRAGYSEKTAKEIGHENLTKPHIAEAIAAAQEQRAARTEITADMVLREYAKLAFANITDYVKVAEHETMSGGEPVTFTRVEVFGTDGIPADKMAAVSEIKETKEGIAVKLHDKKGALDSLARHLGMFNDKLQIEGKVVVFSGDDQLED